MKQPIRLMILEAVINTASGYALSFMLGFIIFYYGFIVEQADGLLDATIKSNKLTLIYTALSVARNFAVRWIFNK